MKTLDWNRKLSYVSTAERNIKSIWTARSLFSAVMLFFIKSKCITFIAQTTGIIHWFENKIKSNKHIADGHKKLFCAFKREAVQYLVAKNLAVSHLPLKALPTVQTANATARPWSRDILWFAICGFPWKTWC